MVRSRHERLFPASFGEPLSVIVLSKGHRFSNRVPFSKSKNVEFGADYYDQRDKSKTVSRLVARLARLGYNVDLKPQRALPTEAAPEEGSNHREPLVPEPARPKKRGRPCKCIERGIICKHHPSIEPKSLIHQSSSPGIFS